MSSWLYDKISNRILGISHQPRLPEVEDKEEVEEETQEAVAIMVEETMVAEGKIQQAVDDTLHLANS